MQKFLLYFFADDSLLFLWASKQECIAVQEILQRYERASGQLGNVDKSAVLFSCSTPPDIRWTVIEQLGVSKFWKEISILDYRSWWSGPRKGNLGVWRADSGAGCKVGKANSCLMRGRPLKYKQWHKWFQFMPCVVSSFPGCFIIELNMLIERFWWGNGEEKRKIHWLSWDTVNSKVRWWLGLQRFWGFNLALLGKQCW